MSHGDAPLLDNSTRAHTPSLDFPVTPRSRECLAYDQLHDKPLPPSGRHLLWALGFLGQSIDEAHLPR